MGKTGLINCFGGWASTPNSIESRLSDLSATRTAKCGIEGFQLADTHENHSICDSGLQADLRRRSTPPCMGYAYAYTNGPLRTFVTPKI